MVLRRARQLLNFLALSWLADRHSFDQKGGDITLILPSVLGYGTQGVGSIPPNSVLVFDIQLLDVK